MLTCLEFAKIYEDYRTGKAPYTQRMGAVVHLAMCRHCRKYVRQIDLVIEITHEIRESETYDCPDALKSKLRQAYLAKHSA